MDSSSSGLTPMEPRHVATVLDPHRILKQNTTQIDLRLLDYISPVDSYLECPICHCPFIKPRKLACDHTFCQNCLVFAFLGQSRDQKTCPSCRDCVDDTDGTALPRLITNLIEDLIVKCPLHSRGCTLQLRRGHVQDHIELYCDYAETICPNATCNLTIQRRFRVNRCLHGEISCEHCHKLLLEKDLESHWNQECKKYKTSCPDCSQEMLQSELGKHIANCPEVHLSCPAASIGCNFRSKRSDILQHKTVCTLDALLPTFQAMNRRISDQDEALKIIRQRGEMLEAGLSSIQGILGTSAAAAPDIAASHFSFPNVSPSPTSLETLGSRENPPFDSATHHLLSLHEALREEVDRVSAAVSELDARSSMTIMNESLRAKEDLAHTNAIIGSMRMQLHWLTSARLQAQPRNSIGSGMMAVGAGPSSGTTANMRDAQPIRRLSDSSRQDTKL